MPLTLSQSDYYELIRENATAATEAKGKFEGKWHYPESLGHGYFYWIELRDGIEMAITRYQLRHQVMTTSEERPHPVECTFYLEGCETYADSPLGPNCYGLFGSGLAPGDTSTLPAERPHAWLSLHIDPERFSQWLGYRALPLPELLRSPEQLYYNQFGTMTAPMQIVLHQILHCPYIGVIKQFYLESKAWELVTLCLHDTLSHKQPPGASINLKPADIERIHHARDILLQHFDNPPTLAELAQQIHLNECSLKRGFRQVFGITVFGYLHHYRMDYARQLLEQGAKTVTSVAHTVGFTSRSSFARAFRKKFGINPGQYLRQG